MAKVNPINAKFCLDFTLAKTPPHLIATNLAKMDPLKIKAIYLLAIKIAKSFHIKPYFPLVTYISLYLKGTRIAKVKSELEKNLKNDKENWKITETEFKVHCYINEK